MRFSSVYRINASYDIPKTIFHISSHTDSGGSSHHLRHEIQYHLSEVAEIGKNVDQMHVVNNPILIAKMIKDC